MGTFEWKDKFDSDLAEGSLKAELLYQGTPIDSIPFSLIKKDRPTKFITRIERWCPHCLNAESYVRDLKNIEKECQKEYVQKVCLVINENVAYEETFTVKNVINWLDARHITDGSLQRKALVRLSLIGFIDRLTIIVKDKKGKEHIKYWFKKNRTVRPKLCLQDGEHKLNFEKEGIKTRLYWKDK